MLNEWCIVNCANVSCLRRLCFPPGNLLCACPAYIKSLKYEPVLGPGWMDAGVGPVGPYLCGSGNRRSISFKILKGLTGPAVVAV